MESRLPWFQPLPASLTWPRHSHNVFMGLCSLLTTCRSMPGCTPVSTRGWMRRLLQGMESALWHCVVTALMRPATVAKTRSNTNTGHLPTLGPRQGSLRSWRGEEGNVGPVSYTHLTLPTIYSV